MTETTEDFCKRLGGFVGPAMLACGISVGNTLRLFDIILDSDTPLTSSQIAEKGNFKERYVREWLSMMSVGKIIDFANNITDVKDLSSQTFTIPENRRSVLHSQVRGPDIGSFLSMVPILTNVKDELVKCFAKDGPEGISYDKYKGFHEWKNDLNVKRNSAKDTLESLEVIEGMREQLDKGIQVLELGCGSGISSIELARKFPNSTIYAFDISEKAIGIAKQSISKETLPNLIFSVNDACAMPLEWSSKFDLILCWDVIHDVPKSDVALTEVARVLKPGGVVSVVEPRMRTDPKENMDNEIAPFIYGASLFHCTPVSLFFEGGLGLGAAWGKERAMELFTDAGFDDIIVKDIISRHHYNFILRRSL